MRLFFFSYLLFMGYVSFSQNNTYVVSYKDFGRSDAVVVGRVGEFETTFKKIDYLLAFNDTIAISFYGLNGNMHSFEKFYIEKKQQSHSVYYYRPNESFYFLNGRNKKKQNLLLDTTKKHIWHLIDSSKIIINHTCKLAYSITSKNDTLVAWYSTLLKYPYGFYDFNGLPGVALEIISQSDYRHIIATKIETKNIPIYFPSNLKAYYYQDWKQGFH